MIGIKLQGRLGNQLFQYAFIYSTAKKLNTSFYLDQTSQKFILSDFFEIPPNFGIFLEKKIFSIPGYKNIFSYRLRKFYYQLLYKYKTFNSVNVATDTEYVLAISQMKDKTLFQGYFQSELYFNEYIKDLKCFFTIKKHFIVAYKNKYAHLFKNHKKIIVVHIRQTDYSELGHLNLGADNLSLPLSYYHNLLKPMQSAGNQFIFISDDTKIVEEEFNYLKEKFISIDDMINDFQHLLNADICVIANSTFSWWGARLNTKLHKQVYAPKYFLGHQINKTWPPDIYPSNWNLIDVTNTDNHSVRD